MMINRVFLFSIFTILITGCSKNILTLQERLNIAKSIAQKDALHASVFKTGNFDIYAYYTTFTCKSINVYIEGDGFAWITSSTISKDPTPMNPIGLKLMSKDSSKCKLYLARPCQYKQSPKCEKKYWTSHRFSKEIIDSYNQLLNTFKDKNFYLFGYSGGGAIATLLAAHRSDVKRVVTIAGNLDTDYWTKKHYLTPLKGSLNPALYSNKLKDTKQIHLIGEKDSIIDKSICANYIKKYKNKTKASCKIYKGFTHHEGWVENWETILKNSGF